MRAPVYLMGFLLLLVGSVVLVSVDGEVNYSQTLTDETGDVEPNQNSGIDITSLSSRRSGEDLIIELTVAGDLDEYIINIYFEVDDVDYVLSDMIGIVNLVSDDSYYSQPNLTIEGGVATFNLGSDVEASQSFVLVNAETADASYNIDMIVEDNSGDDDEEPTYDDDEMYAPDDTYENTADPGTETPTDTSISVDIAEDDYDFYYGHDDTVEEWTEEFFGTTSGEVHTCAWSKVFYMKDGSTSEIYWETGPMNMPEMTVSGTTMGRYFKGTGTGGADDWSDWDCYQFAERPWDENNDPPAANDSCVNIEDVEQVKIYVRAFGDEDFQNWNQDSIDVTDEYLGSIDWEYGDDDIGDDDTGDDDTSGNKTDDDDSEDTPGFGLIMLATAVIIAVVLVRRRK